MVWAILGRGSRKGSLMGGGGAGETGGSAYGLFEGDR